MPNSIKPDTTQVELIKEQINDGISNRELTDFVRYMLSCGKTRAREILMEIKLSMVSLDKQKDILTQYSKDGGNMTVAEIAQVNDFAKTSVEDVIRENHFKKSHIPQFNGDTKAELDRIFFAQYQNEATRALYKAQKDDAIKYRRILHGEIEPFVEAVNNLKLELFAPVPYYGPVETKDKVLVIGLSDIHYGGYADPDESFVKRGYSTDQAVESIAEYLRYIADHIDCLKQGYDKAIIISLGDICHTYDGKTVKGTVVKHDMTKIPQYQAAKSSINNFISGVMQLVKEVEVYSVRGNHWDFADWALFDALEGQYLDNPRISFHNIKADYYLLKINPQTAAIIAHGASAEIKHLMPEGDKRDAHINELFLKDPEQMIGVKQRLLITGDQHHQEVQESRGYTHYMLPSVVDGDLYAETKGFYSTPAQISLVVGKKGVENTLICSFD